MQYHPDWMGEGEQQDNGSLQMDTSEGQRQQGPVRVSLSGDSEHTQECSQAMFTFHISDWSNKC